VTFSPLHARAQFLCQDAVRARLGKEAHAFHEAAAGAAAPPPAAAASSGRPGSGSGGAGAAAGPYGVEAARRLAADFARLGDAPDGLPYLAHLRQLIIGAAPDLAPLHVCPVSSNTPD
jgi:hypothetical protein